MMHRKLISIAAPLFLCSLFLTSCYLARHQLRQIPNPLFSHIHDYHDSIANEIPQKYIEKIEDGTVLRSAEIKDYIDEIFGRHETDLSNLECPIINQTRYSPLISRNKSKSDIHYFFALNLRTNLNPLPRLLGSIVEVAKFLGPDNCVLSIVEGNSKDGTQDVLQAIRPSLEAIGLRYHFKRSDVDPGQGNRIHKLALLRNAALEPLLELKGQTNTDTVLSFINDVTACPEDLLELILQRQTLGADMTCAMDWTYVGPDPTFYDVWVSRSIHGEIFFDIPPDNSWDNAWNLFWNDDPSQARYVANRPFQVFSCWNGATVFRAQPFLDGLQFRGPTDSECFQGEAELICKDLWLRGHGKIAVVPSVNLEYTVERGRQIKQLKGYTSDIVSIQDSSEDSISWQLEPPEMVKCMPDFKRQSWRPWN
ncbi:hypothetical protein Golomagni_06598, partial [Golovinomyces magnicellulatus]